MVINAKWPLLPIGKSGRIRTVIAPVDDIVFPMMVNDSKMYNETVGKIREESKHWYTFSYDDRFVTIEKDINGENSIVSLVNQPAFF